MTTLRTAAHVGAFLFLVLIVGCGGCPNGRIPPPIISLPRPDAPPWPLDIEVKIDQAAFLRQLSTVPSVEVNIVGVNELELQEWSGMSMTNYWRPDNPRRLQATDELTGYAKVITFGQRRPTAAVLYSNDPTWARWSAKKTQRLLVLSNYPRVAKDQFGDADIRRLSLPWGAGAWQSLSSRASRGTIKLLVTPGGVLCETPPAKP